MVLHLVIQAHNQLDRLVLAAAKGNGVDLCEVREASPTLVAQPQIFDQVQA